MDKHLNTRKKDKFKTNTRKEKIRPIWEDNISKTKVQNRKTENKKTVRLRAL